MDQLTDIPWNVSPRLTRDPTLEAFRPLLEKNRSLITEIAKKTFKYGDTDRHFLDIYWPPVQPTSSNGKTPILFYVYGGGFVAGDRNSLAPFDLMLSSLGAFFARRGFITIIPDYRLAPEFKYPTPVEDILNAIKWTLNHGSELITPTTLDPDLDSLTLAGHSAGAVHAATSILHPTLIPLESDLRKKIKGVVLMSGPFHFPPITEIQVFEAYYGTEKNAREKSPLSLLLKWIDTKPKESLPKILLIEAQYEPEWIFDMGVDYQKVLEWHLGEAVPMVIGKGHNHISLICSPSSGEGEEWGVETVEWIWKNLKGVSAVGSGISAGSGADTTKHATDDECSECHQRRNRSFTIQLGTESVSSKVGVMRTVLVIFIKLFDFVQTLMT
ncbi:CAZyme family CE10 [Agaricus bisporus var. burnettii]|uniref:CAZyme family CE10 n=1 Tax=Agaricus bisporus var. burnettii TaxID=192524 RepID=A0A8H7C2C6_AGABI|nr:CAZyme family CE10 [Agaricus bisporus var. burnettii]